MGNVFYPPKKQFGIFDDSMKESDGITHESIKGTVLVLCDDFLNNTTQKSISAREATMEITVPKGATVIKNGVIYRTNVFKVNGIYFNLGDKPNIYSKCYLEMHRKKENRYHFREGYTYVKELTPESLDIDMNDLYFYKREKSWRK